MKNFLSFAGSGVGEGGIVGVGVTMLVGVGTTSGGVGDGVGAGAEAVMEGLTAADGLGVVGAGAVVEGGGMGVFEEGTLESF